MKVKIIFNLIYLNFSLATTKFEPTYARRALYARKKNITVILSILKRKPDDDFGNISDSLLCTA